jgi:hypothetical protein
LPTSGKPSEKNHAFLSYKFFIMVMNNQKWLFFTETTITDCLPTLDTKKQLKMVVFVENNQKWLSI